MTEELHPLRAWLCWRFKVIPGHKPRKVPHYASGAIREGQQGAPSDLAALVTFSEAQAACERLEFDGVGLAMRPELGLVALDFDDCATDGVVDPRVLDLVAGTYAELSPSRNGVRAFFRGSLPDGKSLDVSPKVEVFCSTGFVTVTGDALPGAELWGITELSDEVLALHAERFAPVDDLDTLRGPVEVETMSEIAEAIRALKPSRADDRNQWLEIVLALLSLKGTEHEAQARALAHEFSARSSKYNRAEIDRKFDRETSRRLSHRTIFKRAQEDGWTNPQAADDSLSDVALSKLLADFFDGRYLYEHNGVGWRMYRGGAWIPCEHGEHVEDAKRLGPRIMANPTKNVDKVMALVRRANSAAGINAALTLAQSDPRIAVTHADFDRDPDLLNVANGVVHLPSGELRPHDPALRMARQCPVPYEPKAHRPAFDRFMRQISNEDDDWLDYLQRVMGYTLSAHVREEKLFFFLGRGANGKSVLANIVRRIMGTYTASVPPGFLMVSQRDGDGPTPSLASLPGARLALANEVEAGSRLSAQMVKVACSTEEIAARHLHKGVFRFVPRFKLWVRGNHKPIIADNDDGIWRRIDLIPFDFQATEKDPHLEDKLMREAPSILAWMVAGYSLYLRDRLRPARRVAAASLEYRRESDLLGQWLDEECETGGRFECEQGRAYTCYRQWAAEQGLVRPMAKKTFTQGLQERGMAVERRSTGERSRVYVGFRLQSILVDVGDLF